MPYVQAVNRIMWVFKNFFYVGVIVQVCVAELDNYEPENSVGLYVYRVRRQELSFCSQTVLPETFSFICLFVSF